MRSEKALWFSCFFITFILGGFSSAAAISARCQRLRLTQPTFYFKATWACRASRWEEDKQRSNAEDNIPQTPNHRVLKLCTKCCCFAAFLALPAKSMWQHWVCRLAFNCLRNKKTGAWGKCKKQTTTWRHKREVHGNISRYVLSLSDLLILPFFSQMIWNYDSMFRNN